MVEKAPADWTANKDKRQLLKLRNCPFRNERTTRFQKGRLAPDRKRVTEISAKGLQGIMASLNLAATSSPMRRPELFSGTGNFRRNVTFLPGKRRPMLISFAAKSTEPEPPNPAESPEIDLEFIGPQAGSDGTYPVERAKAISGEKLLRNIMSDNKIELYAAYGKLMNCGGGGSCGTCIVEIIDGQDLLNDRTNTELRYLNKKPESWRLACQTIVGNKTNSGKVVVQRLPQWKK